MANAIGSVFRDFWHTMTSNDRHSSFDSPQRTGRHVPLQNGRNIMTGIATASDSRADIHSPYFDDSRAPSAQGSPTNGTRGYSPGLRSQNVNKDGFEVQSPGDVAMQSFENGLPPPPPVAHSWRRIDAWAEENYPELFDQLCEGATNNDLNDLEHQLDCSLPQDVRESLMIHDGQERGGMPSGIIFGSMLMDCEEIPQEWETWRQVNQQFMLDAAANKPPTPSGSEASSSRQRPGSSSSSNGPGEWRQNLLAKQTCIPPNTVQKAYAHSGWIPLVRDWGGNNLAVDLAPGPAGRYGQIILFGRDYDTKYVVARSWAAFLAVVADDLNSGKWFVDEETNELKLREFKDARVEPSYFNILRWRMDQKHGRRAAAAKRQSQGPSQTASKSNSPLGSRSASPYANPQDSAGDIRGRSMQRLRDSAPLTSPMRNGLGKPQAPLLSRVTEEATIELTDAVIEPSTLVDVEDDDDSPRNSEEGKRPTVTTLERTSSDLAKDKGKEVEVPKAASKTPEVVIDDTMKEIEI
ncbi:cell wall assembly and cell proliferation coordinating protein [Trichoderma sp. SZMC 28013]